MYFCAAFWTEKQYIANFFGLFFDNTKFGYSKTLVFRKVKHSTKAKFSKTSFPNSSKFYSYAALLRDPSVVSVSEF